MALEQVLGLGVAAHAREALDELLLRDLRGRAGAVTKAWAIAPVSKVNSYPEYAIQLLAVNM